MTKGEGKLTKAQRRVLAMIGQYERGRPLGAGAVKWAPVKRLLRRRLIEKSGHAQDRALFSITPAGLSALKDQNHG